jgi:cytochrome c oxidase assembly protein subunit 15
MNDQTSTPTPTRPHHGIDLLAVGFGTVVAMWIVGYLTHMPLIQAPGALVFALLIAVLLGGGFVLGRYGRRNLGGAILTGLIAAVLNLLVLGALLADMKEGGPSPLLWLPGYFLATIGIVVVGWLIGLKNHVDRPTNWAALFALATVGAVALVVSAGGLVTGFDAGFSVPDWPNTYGSNMFLFPLSRMTGGIYYEHTHRMAGALVGLTAMALMIWTWTTRRSRSIKWFTTAAFVLVCIQGVLGGVWVTEVDPADVEAMAHAVALPDGTFAAEPSLIYVILHGTTGQLILAMFVALAAMMTTTWQREGIEAREQAAAIDLPLSMLLVIGLTVQLMLGVWTRKTDGGAAVLLHITLAAFIAVLAVGASVRATALWGKRYPVLKRTGAAVGILIVVQLCLGLLALLFRDTPATSTVVVGSDQVSSAGDAIFTTLHQSTGAALLALAALLLTWNYRLLKPPPMPAKQPSSAGAPA